MLFVNGQVFTDRRFQSLSFRVEQGRFVRLGDLSARPGEEVMDLQGAKVIPGLVDIHTHGNSGADFSDGDYEGLCTMAAFSARMGVTSFAPTSMTLPYETLAGAFSAAAALAAEARPDCARIAGIHMEGPFFSEKKKGAQNADYLRRPDFEAFRALQEGCGGLVRIVDVAPELEGALPFIRQAKELCTVSVAHTDADYEQSRAAFEAGAGHLTHLFNAMPGLHHRQPGVIPAAAEREDVRAELIGDGLHVHESMVRLAFRLFPERICLISDSLRCCGMPEGEYELGGQTVQLKDNIARLPDGTIAGSASHLYDCLKNILRFGIPEPEAIEAATLRPAQVLGRQEEIGSIGEGKWADFVVCGDEYRRLAVYLGGRKIPDSGE